MTYFLNYYGKRKYTQDSGIFSRHGIGNTEDCNQLKHKTLSPSFIIDEWKSPQDLLNEISMEWDDSEEIQKTWGIIHILNTNERQPPRVNPTSHKGHSPGSILEEGFRKPYNNTNPHGNLDALVAKQLLLCLIIYSHKTTDSSFFHCV